MGITRGEIQKYALVADLVSETLVPDDNDVVGIAATGRLYAWVAGSVAVADAETTIDQTAVTATGRWISITASPKKLTGTVAFPLLANGQSAIVTAAIVGLPIGSLVLANVSNGNVAYTGATPIPADVFISQGMVIALDTVSFQIVNETGASLAAFTANIVVSKL